jgi:hypothetical protein
MCPEHTKAAAQDSTELILMIYLIVQSAVDNVYIEG